MLHPVFFMLVPQRAWADWDRSGAVKVLLFEEMLFGGLYLTLLALLSCPMQYNRVANPGINCLNPICCECRSLLCPACLVQGTSPIPVCADRPFWQSPVCQLIFG
jgi:hypothetical protein